MPMRLLNTKTLKLEYFRGQTPDYAILSHMWGENEVLLENIQRDILWDEVIQVRTEYAKIFNCCRQAKSYGLEYVWIDTCCIDKSSSAELSEAINSMFKWYALSRVCLVYLADVSPDTGVTNINDESSNLCQSRWFSRGWTLQELLAPEHVVFFNNDWERIGSKDQLHALISKHTSIPTDVLCHRSEIVFSSVAQRMSWASRRDVTVPEDIAYSLMGLFNVNMPLLYGEGGGKAFKRLQYAIFAEDDDETIFAWNSIQSVSESSMLASHPVQFSRSSHIVPDLYVDLEGKASAFTNRGLHMGRRLILASLYPSLSESNRLGCKFLLPLNAVEFGTYKRLAICLYPNGNVYYATEQDLPNNIRLQRSREDFELLEHGECREAVQRSRLIDMYIG